MASEEAHRVSFWSASEKWRTPCTDTNMATAQLRFGLSLLIILGPTSASLLIEMRALIIQTLLSRPTQELEYTSGMRDRGIGR